MYASWVPFFYRNRAEKAFLVWGQMLISGWRNVKRGLKSAEEQLSLKGRVFKMNDLFVWKCNAVGFGAANVLERLVPSADFSMFDGAMEFLVGNDDDDYEDDDDEDFSMPPSSPMQSHLGMPHVALETLPWSFCYERRHVQAAAVGMQTNSFHRLLPRRELESFSPAHCYTGYFTLKMRGWNDRRKQMCLRTHNCDHCQRPTHHITNILCVNVCVYAVLSDGVMLDVIFFPATPGTLHWKPLPVTHDNTWESVLSHGGFSSHAPPPSPGKKNNSIENISSC